MKSRSYRIKSCYGVVSREVYTQFDCIVLRVGSSSPKAYFLLGTRSSNLLRHLEKSFLPSVCFLPVAGYMVRFARSSQSMFMVVSCLTLMLVSVVSLGRR